MFKRCFSPLTLVNQLALIVMLSTAIGVLLAAVPLDAKDQKLLDEMEQTAFSPELTRAAERDGQQKQLRAWIAW